MTCLNLKCSCCGAEKPAYPARATNGWWHLSGYYGLFGLFCHKCYDAVSHNAYGVPNHPKKYKEILERMKKSLTSPHPCDMMES